MTLIFAGAEIESYDLTGSNQFVNTTAANRFDSDYARMSVEHSGAGAANYFGTSFTAGTEFWLHCEMVHEVANTVMDNSVIRLVDSVSGNTTLKFEGNDGEFALEYWNGSSYTRLLKTVYFAVGSVHVIDIYCKIADSGGRFAVYIDGNLQDEFVGDTNLWAGAQVNGIELCGSYTIANASASTHFSEVIVATTPTIGWRVATIVPNADGTTTGQWTGSFADVDEVTNSDSDLLTSGTANDLETMGATNLSAPAGALIDLIGFVLQCRVRRGASGPTQFQFAVRTGGTDYFSATIGLGTAFTEEENIWAVNPGTTNPWTASEIDAIEIGVKSIA